MVIMAPLAERATSPLKKFCFFDEEERRDAITYLFVTEFKSAQLQQLLGNFASQY